MNKIFALSVLLFLSLMVVAQSKEVVLVDYFTKKYSGTRALMNSVREMTLKTFVNKGRHKIIDVESLEAIYKEKLRQSSETGLNVANAERLAHMKELGADYIVSGTILDYDVNFYRDSEGKKCYEASLHFTLKVISVLDGTSIGVEDVAVTNAISYDSRDDALMSAVKQSERKIEKAIHKLFPFKVSIVEIASQKKGAAKVVLIEAGSAMGLHGGDIFKVYATSMFHGKKRKKEIGKLRVSKVEDENFSLCKVVEGGDVILKDFNEEKELIVISAGESLTTGLGKDALNFLK